MLRCCLYEMVISVRGNEQHKCFVICIGNCCKIRWLCCVLLCCVVLCVMFCCVVCRVMLFVMLCTVLLRCMLCCVVCYVVYCCVMLCTVVFPYQLQVLCRSKLRFTLSSTFWFVSVLWDRILTRIYFLMCHS
jgi:hypothetical protein